MLSGHSHRAVQGIMLRECRSEVSALNFGNLLPALSSSCSTILANRAMPLRKWISNSYIIQGPLKLGT